MHIYSYTYMYMYIHMCYGPIYLEYHALVSQSTFYRCYCSMEPIQTFRRPSSLN